MLVSWLLLGTAGVAVAKDGYVKFDLGKSPHKVKRQSGDLEQNVTLAEQRTLYELDLTIGTPPQSFNLDLDTGSSNIWVSNSQDSQCNTQQGGCPGGSFTPGDSSTYSVVSQGAFQIGYGDGTGAEGDYITDKVTIGQTVLKPGLVTIGLANKLIDGSYQNNGQGLVGVGYRANFAGADPSASPDQLPNTVVSALVQAGDINREAYSLWLDSQQDGVGSIIFGGVDSTKYSGDLVALQTLQSNNGVSNYSEFLVSLTGISVKDVSGTRLLTDSSFAVPALLDSGTTLTQLPPNVFNAISAGFGVSNGQLPCSYRNADASLIYHFGGDGGPSIEVSLAALTDLPGPYTFQDGTPACYFNAQSETDNLVILGDSFMRSGYFVYDLENNVIAVAQANFAVSGESVTSIASGTDIPGCTSTNTYSISAAAATTLPPVNGPAQTSDSNNLPGTPTFSLGSVATETGKGSSNAAASTFKTAGSAFVFAASGAVLMMVL